MWIFRYTYCLFQGHAFVDIKTSRDPYRYCLHCGKIIEPAAILKDRRHAFNQNSQLSER